MTSTVVVRGSAGAIFVMDVPPAGYLREMFDEKLATGSLTIIEPAADTLTASSEAPSVAPDAPRRGRPPKVRPDVSGPSEAPVPIEE